MDSAEEHPVHRKAGVNDEYARCIPSRGIYRIVLFSLSVWDDDPRNRWVKVPLRRGGVASAVVDVDGDVR